MEYGQSDSSGTDDDLPPPHMNRMPRGGGRVTGNGRAAVGTLSYGRPTDMESQIHWMEQEAYSAVLRAFIAQSDAFSWDKEGLISNLRKELRVSDMEHRELLGKVNADDLLRQIREWRQASSNQDRFISNAVCAPVPTPGPTVPASRKKQKTAHIMSSLPPILPLMHTAPAALPSSAAARRGLKTGAKGRKSKVGQLQPAASPIVKGPQGPAASGSRPVARGQVVHRGPPGPPAPLEAGNIDSFIGRKVRTRWPEDDNFYEAVITNYDPENGTYALVYDINTPRETWEWVNLKEISPQDIQWDDSVPVRFGEGEAGRGRKQSVGRGKHVPPSGRGFLKGQNIKGSAYSQNGIGKKESDNIEIRETDKLIKEVERVCKGDHPNPADVEKAKVALKEHEQSLVEAIARLADASDDEDGQMPNSSPPLSNRERVWRNRQVNGKQNARDDEDDTTGGGRNEGSDREPMVGEGGVASDDQQDDDDGDEDG